MARDIFKKIAQAKVSGGGEYIRDGRGRVVLVGTKTHTNEDGINSYIAELKVLRSQKIPVTSPKTGAALDIEPNAEGSTFSEVYKLAGGDQGKVAVSRMKAFVMGLFGLDESDEGAIGAALEELWPEKGDTQHLGLVMDYQTYRKLTKKSGDEIVATNWKHVLLSGDNSSAAVAARRAELGI